MDLTSQHDLPTLPIDILRLISLASPAAYLAMLPTCKAIQHPNLNYIMKYFTRPRAVGNKIIYCLPNGVPHVSLDDSIPTCNDIDILMWYYMGRWHRDGDKPAIICYNYKSTTQKWYYHGRLHRNDDKPAIVVDNCAGVILKSKWYQYGDLHRDNDLPAIVSHKGKKEWYQHGELHRDGDKPACIGNRGLYQWYHHGLLHRNNGKPIFELVGITPGIHDYYYYGIQYTPKEN